MDFIFLLVNISKLFILDLFLDVNILLIIHLF